MRQRAVSRSIPIRVRAAGSQRSRRSADSSQCRHRRSPVSREVGLFGFRPWAVAVSKFQTAPSDTGRSWIRLSHELVSVEHTQNRTWGGQRFSTPQPSICRRTDHSVQSQRFCARWRKR
jgi:hypothetical protein